jgi:hypothetical protein
MATIFNQGGRPKAKNEPIDVAGGADAGPTIESMSAAAIGIIFTRGNNEYMPGVRPTDRNR